MKDNNITNALKRLVYEINNSKLSPQEKNALLQLVGKILLYYERAYDEIMDGVKELQNKKLCLLESNIVDYIVSINDSVNGKNDVFCIVSMIYKEINYDPKKGRFKVKRLI